MAARSQATPPRTADLSELASAARGCEACELYVDATQTVFGAGAAGARAMLIGEQPGDVEDRQGAPFVGPAGRLLDRALEQAGIDRSATYVTNAVKHFRWKATDRGNRRLHQSPSAANITACRPWLHAEYASVRPRLVVCMGAVAAKSVFGPSARVGADRGAIMERDSLLGEGAFLVTIHPSAVLRAQGEDREAALAGFVADLRVAAEYLETAVD